MAVTIQLPKRIEEAYATAARELGVSVDALVTDVLVSHAPAAEPQQHPELVLVGGVPVLRTGQPLDPAIVSDADERMILGWIVEATQRIDRHGRD